MRLAAEEYQRFLGQLRELDAAEWSAATSCPGWDVRAMAGHVLAMAEGSASMRENLRQLRTAKRQMGDGLFIDALTALQVEKYADATPDELLARLADVGPKAARGRRKTPRPVRAMKLPIPQTFGGVTEEWRMGYLVDVILTRDTWMHRVDIVRATGRPHELTAEHDGRLVADVVAEWARRHGQPVTLHLTGPAGGRFVSGTGGQELTLDAVEFCRILSGRAEGTGLLAQEVPF